jgi:membrane associated rhomboid family serine protease
MANCPKCGIALETIRQRDGVYYYCYQCHGRAVTVSQIRRTAGDKFASGLVRKINKATEASERPCPFCHAPMRIVEIYQPEARLDTCKPCTAVWFDAGVFEELPEGVIDSPDNILLSAAEAEAQWKIQERLRLDERTDSGPDEDWKWIPAALGLPVKYDTPEMTTWPWALWGLSLVITIVSLYAMTDLEDMVNDFGMIPAEVWRYGGLTLLTSFFLHAGLMHLVGNLYFFLVFGGNVEDYLGRWRFLALVFLSALVGDVFHIMLNPHSTEPCIGASGGISGVLVFFALEFPRARLGFFSWRWGWIRIPAWGGFVLWFLLQLFGIAMQRAGLSQVSSMAHVGGVTTGFLLWLWWRKLGPKQFRVSRGEE